MDASSHGSYPSARNNRRNSAGVPMNLVSMTVAEHFGQGSVYTDLVGQPPPLKRSRTTQSSRHAHPSPMSTGMMSFGSSPGSGVTNMPPPSGATIPRHYDVSLVQSLSQDHLQDVNEMDLDGLGVEPLQYLRGKGCEDLDQPSFSPVDGQFITADMANTAYTTQGYAVPSTCGSLTDATSFDAAMSIRLSDGYTDAGSLSADMVQVDSQSSFVMPFGAHDGSPVPNYTYNTGVKVSKDTSYGSDEAVRGMGSQYLTPSYSSHGNQSSCVPGYLQSGGQAMERTESVNTFSSLGFKPPPDVEAFVHANQQLGAMERSASACSAQSNASLSMRAKHSLRRHNDNASKTLIQPKKAPVITAAAPADMSYGHGPSSRIAVGRAPDHPNSSHKNGKVEITKAKRERPKNKKLHCNLCNLYPEGFRGEHELRRHKNSKHATNVKKWICRDPNLVGIETSIQVVRPLEGCKHCDDKKTYGIDYNAAAHLRRTHFKEKPARKGTSSAKAGAKRASRHDVDTPTDLPMSELKKWMVEITVTANQAHSVAEADDADEEEHGDLEWSAQVDSAETAAGLVDDDAFLGMGDAFSGDAAAAASMSTVYGEIAERGTSAHGSDQMPMGNGFHQTMYNPEGLISSANFIEPQMNAAHLPLDLAGFIPSDIVSSPSGTTITQGTARRFIADQNLDAFAQNYGGFDGLEYFSFLSPDICDI